MSNSRSLQRLLNEGPRAINLGLKEFAEALKVQGGEVVHVDWSPPPPETEDLQNILDKLL